MFQEGFEGFEGFKRIKNEKNFDIEKIYSILEKYQKEMGAMSYSKEDEKTKIIIDVPGKYNIEIRISGKDIIIERILEEGQTLDEISDENGKVVEMAQTDRMIDQIYDLLNDYIDDGIITEHITSTKQVLTMKEVENKGIFLNNDFYKVTNEENKVIYEIDHKKFNKLFSIKSLECHMEVASMSYEKVSEGKYSIQEKPFTITVIKRDTTTEKLRFISEGAGKKIKISADFTDNHYLVELNEGVIGAIDCLRNQGKKEYRIEINTLKEKHFVVSVAVMLDIYMRDDIKM